MPPALPNSRPSRLNRLADWAANGNGFPLLALALFLLGMAIVRLRLPTFSFTSLVLRYQELGLVKRGLLGTLLSPLLPLPISSAGGTALWVLLALAMALLLIGLIRALLSCPERRSRLLALGSPALFLQLGYGFFFLDLFTLSCHLGALLLIQRRRQLQPGWLTALVGLVVIGVLFHELFLVAFLPLLIGVASRRSRGAALLLTISGGLLALLMARHGAYEGGAAALTAQLAPHLAAPLQPATFELTSSLATNITLTQRYLLDEGHLRQALPGALYLALLASAIRPINAQQWLLLAACLSPLALAPMAGDVSRWLGFACINILILVLMGLLPLRPTRWQTWLLAASLLLGPIGVVASFPLIQSKLGSW